MIRDFTDEDKNVLYNQMGYILPRESIENVMESLKDVIHEPINVNGITSFENLLQPCQTYQQLILDWNDINRKRIDNIFENVIQVEMEYNQKLNGLLGYLQLYVSQFERLTEMIKPGKSISMKTQAEKLRLEIVKREDILLKLLLEGYTIVADEENRTTLEQKLEELTYNRYNGKKDVSKMKEEDIKSVVLLYELLHPIDKKNMDAMLSSGNNNTLTEEDKNKIKYIAYTAEEPYRTVYLAYADDYEVGAYDGVDDGGNMDEGSRYNWEYDEMYFVGTEKAFSKDPRGPYTTWFHENGHAIDYNSEKGEAFYCHNFTTYSEKMQANVTLQEAIYFDVYNDIESKIRTVMGDAEIDIEHVLDSFRYGWEDVVLTEEEESVREKVLKMYHPGGVDSLRGAVHEAASDVYGGVTNMAIKVDYGHKETDDNGKYTYWYDSKGNATLAQSRELVAEYFSYYMTGNQNAIESMREHFPSASVVLDEMFVQMKTELEQ